MRPIFWTFFTNGRRSVYVLSLPDSILGPRKQEAEAILTVEPQPCKKILPGPRWEEAKIFGTFSFLQSLVPSWKKD